jgi:hypothetical protein
VASPDVPRVLQAPNNTMVESDLKMALLAGKQTGQQLHRVWRRVRKRLLNGKHINLFVGLASNKAVNCVRLLKAAETGEPAMNSVETRPSFHPVGPLVQRGCEPRRCRCRWRRRVSQRLQRPGGGR